MKTYTSNKLGIDVEVEYEYYPEEIGDKNKAPFPPEAQIYSVKIRGDKGIMVDIQEHLTAAAVELFENEILNFNN